jgi:hypothetical protein
MEIKNGDRNVHHADAVEWLKEQGSLIGRSMISSLPEVGEVTWARGMGTKACELVCQMVLNLTNTRTIVDPFCGHGTVLAIANELGMNTIGVDHKLKYFKKSYISGILKLVFLPGQ